VDSGLRLRNFDREESDLEQIQIRAGPRPAIQQRGVLNILYRNVWCPLVVTPFGAP